MILDPLDLMGLHGLSHPDALGKALDFMASLLGPVDSDTTVEGIEAECAAALRALGRLP